MTDVFVIRNQHGHYWGKGKEWVSGDEPKAVMRARHRDEALNTLFELSSRDIELRGEVIGVGLGARGEPDIEPSQIPLPGTDTPGADLPVAEPESTETVDRPQLVTEEAP
jgi:hypothetical protein